MTSSTDRQSVLENLTAIETTAKLLVNAFGKKTSETELSLNGIHREELILQTTTFLSQAQQIILDLSNTLNLSTDGVFDKKKNLFISDISQKNEDSKNLSTKKVYSLSTVTLEDIIENHLTPKHILPDYPLLHDPIQPNLVSLVRHLRQTENLDEFILKVYSKIFNHEERICCNYHGRNGKLSFPRHKCLLFDLIIQFLCHEHHQIYDENQRNYFYNQCEKHFSKETSLTTKYRGINLDQINHLNDEKQFICSLFRLVIPEDDIKRILLAKQDCSSEWNDNEMCIYYARPIHLLWIKQKWLEKYPLNQNNQSQKWSQCIDWAIESFLESPKIRPSKRKTMDISIDHKRTKPSLTLEEKFKQIDRTKFDVLEYSTQLLHLISNENNQNLPTFEQLQLLEDYIFRFYWTLNLQQTWREILDILSQMFVNDFNEDFRHSYLKYLLEMNQNEEKEIERLLQITLED